MLDFLTNAVRANPHGLALIFGDQTWTYTELDVSVNKIVAWLTKHGVSTNQHVGVLMHNRPEYVFVIHALSRLGAVLVPLNARLTSEELSYQLEKAACSLVIYADETADKSIALPCPTLSIAGFNGDYEALGAVSLELDMNAPQAIVFTSGTTGQPKGAALTYSNHFWSATASAFRLGTLPHDRWLCPLPLYHVGGLSVVMRSALYGTAIVLQNGFDLNTVNNALDHQAVTLASLVPTMLYRLLEARTAAPPHLRLILLGGSAASAELVERAHTLGIAVSTTYGLSEACSQVATQTPEGTRRKPASVGKPLPFVSVRVVDDNGQTLPAGHHGEVVVRGPNVMTGYYDDPEATVRTIRDGELYTGDLGYLDDDGDLWLVQRRSDLIVSGGENIYPAEIEAVLKTHPVVADACVVGIPNAEWGQQVAAAVVLNDGKTLDADALTAYARQHLAGYKIPRQICFVDALPMTASGKIERRSVTRLFE